jgi:FAD:protein FMN transferase
MSISRRRQFLRCGLGLGLGSSVSLASRASELHWRESTLQGLGTTLHLRAAHTLPKVVDQALRAAVQGIRHVEAQMSLFDANSALSRLNRDGVLRDPDPHLVAILTLAQQVSERSQGGFDVTVQPLWALWEQARRVGQIPTQDQLARARALVDWRAISLEDERILLTKPGVQITLNGIAQGYAADLAQQALRTHGVEHALIDTGEWSAIGKNPERSAWRLGISDPLHSNSLLHTLALEGQSMATSSDVENSFTPDRRHHQILDPRTGSSPPELALVSVMADSCALADALTKVMFVVGPVRAQQVARAWNVKALVVDKQGVMQQWL